MQELDSIELEVAEALVLYERFLPASELVITVHLMGHLAKQMRDYGPLRNIWMFGFEAFLGSLKGAVKNRAQVTPFNIASSVHAGESVQQQMRLVEFCGEVED